MKILDKVKKISKKPETEKKASTVSSVANGIHKRNQIAKDKAGSVIVEWLFTEKISNLMPLNKYAFKVTGSANKIEVKKAIEGYYGVNVVSVNIIKTSPKPKRVGRREMLKPGFKKAIVTLKAGEIIEPVKAAK